jgi:hypothetical protein
MAKSYVNTAGKRGTILAANFSQTERIGTDLATEGM